RPGSRRAGPERPRSARRPAAARTARRRAAGARRARSARAAGTGAPARARSRPAPPVRSAARPHSTRGSSYRCAPALFSSPSTTPARAICENGGVPFVWISLGAIAGANARYLVSIWAIERLGLGFPYGTLIANASGSLLIGLFMGVLTERTGADAA